MEWDLLEKTTFWVNDVYLKGANLGEVSESVARVLQLQPSEIMVVDVRMGMVVFDILLQKIDAPSIVGKEKEILDILRRVTNVLVGENASIHSEGVLGLIALPPKNADEFLAESNRIVEQIEKTISKRALVFSSGTEVKEKMIKDTNSPYIMDALRKAGYLVQFGGVLDDDEISTATCLEGAVGNGFGLIVSTGGVGAENKDFTIEAIRRLDPKAHTPYILKFTPDNIRHFKEGGVKIAVGSVGNARLVALPGPHEEAKLGCIQLLDGLKQGMDGLSLSEYIAEALRSRWRAVFVEKSGSKTKGENIECKDNEITE